MILLDRRVGSGELLGYLTGNLKLPVTLTDLSYGDLSFLGRGEEEMPVPVGVERKTLRDFLSSMLTGRLPSHQLPGLLKCYQDIWIVIEGAYRADYKTGMIVEPKGKKWVPVETGTATGILATDLDAMFLTLEIRGGVRIHRTASKTETCRWVGTLYRWWTDKAWEQHRSHLRFRSLDADRALLVKPSLCRLMAAQLPAIGWVRSLPVSRKFGSTFAMVNASQKDWAEVEGVGKGIAESVYTKLRSSD